MKRLEALIGKFIASTFWGHVLFCLLFVFMFAVSVVVSGNKGIIPAALCTCLYMLGCIYIGRWCGKSWLAQGVHAPFLQRLFLSSVSLSLLGAVGAGYIYKGSIAAYFIQYLATCFPLCLLFIFLGLSMALARNSLLKQLTEAKLLQQQKESELRLLVSQLSPHFLFNTLNNIVYLPYAMPFQMWNYQVTNAFAFQKFYWIDAAYTLLLLTLSYNDFTKRFHE